ncbi:Helicase POLQ-like [Tetrabaena socialis]|uniref:Helicase POLQ-like n=1 Tax=Tetrabaena socialis TaxID=47790 RepID=A0A2J8AE87_9CHLO|nr:Helicase POLQ-like [Tetrabaena socialis]|eukprot:PNH10835.1 Helicase POLQ-like [Tetrabaena socialis]
MKRSYHEAVGSRAPGSQAGTWSGAIGGPQLAPARPHSSQAHRGDDAALGALASLTPNRDPWQPRQTLPPARETGVLSKTTGAPGPVHRRLNRNVRLDACPHHCRGLWSGSISSNNTRSNSNINSTKECRRHLLQDPAASTRAHQHPQASSCPATRPHPQRRLVLWIHSSSSSSNTRRCMGMGRAVAAASRIAIWAHAANTPHVQQQMQVLVQVSRANASANSSAAAASGPKLGDGHKASGAHVAGGVDYRSTERSLASASVDGGAGGRFGSGADGAAPAVQCSGAPGGKAAQCVPPAEKLKAAALESGEDGSNLVYCAPTSGGKSLVAEVLMIRRLAAAFERQAREQPRAARQHPRPAPARALLVLPYVSIVSEKYEHLARVLAPMRARVVGYTGAEQSGTPLSAPDEVVAVVTMEKANSTVNRLIAEGRLAELCCVVVDEAHMVGDPHRGICLELCLTKLRFAAAAGAVSAAKPASAGPAASAPATSAAAASSAPAPAASAAAPRLPLSCQLVCMSATMSGLDDMCGWLGARLFMTNFRPVPLTEHAVFKGRVFRKLTRQEVEARAREAVGAAAAEAKASCSATDAGAAALTGTAATSTACGADPGPKAASASAPASAAGAADAAAPEPLVEERELAEAGSKDPDRLAALVVEVAAEGHSTLVFCATRSLLADLLPKKLPPVSPETVLARKALLTELQDASGGYLNRELERLIEAGVAYHHAGLTSQERGAVEKGFRSGLLHTLTATSTLAAGINLPARRVILRSLWQGIGPVSRAQYLQMIGRAGRAGQSPIGEAFLIGKGAARALQGEWRDVCRLMTARLPPLRCCLLDAPQEAADGLDGAASRAGAAAAGRARAAAPSTRAASAGVPGAAAADAALGMPAAAPEGGAAKARARLGETHLQRMLLESIANGSVSSGADVEALIRSTLMFQQAGYEHIAAATHEALSALRQRRLATYGAPPAPAPAPPAAPAPGPARRQAAAPAAAAAAAGRGGGGGSSKGAWQPTQMGRAIYESCLPTAAGQGLYNRHLAAPPCKQKLQGDLSKWTGMAAVMAGACNWWALQALLEALSQQASAGARPELLPLMALPGMTGARARGLYAAGLTKPALLAAADEADVKKALASSLPRNLRQPKLGKGAK